MFDNLTTADKLGFVAAGAMIVVGTATSYLLQKRADKILASVRADHEAFMRRTKISIVNPDM